MPFVSAPVDLPKMDIFLQQIINGLVQGSIYALVALGYTMVYLSLIHISEPTRPY